jgi:hypothetical protein
MKVTQGMINIHKEMIHSINITKEAHDSRNRANEIRSLMSIGGDPQQCEEKVR